MRPAAMNNDCKVAVGFDKISMSYWKYTGIAKNNK